jgi:hypothetical protein
LKNIKINDDDDDDDDMMMLLLLMMMTSNTKKNTPTPKNSHKNAKQWKLKFKVRS